MNLAALRRYRKIDLWYVFMGIQVEGRCRRKKYKPKKRGERAWNYVLKTLFTKCRYRHSSQKYCKPQKALSRMKGIRRPNE